MNKAVLAVLVLLLPGLVLAQKPGSRADDRIPDGAYFRYTTPDGVVHMERTLSDGAIYNGYELLDEQGRVLDEVEAAPYETEAQRQARMEKMRSLRRQHEQDEELQRLYAGPEDAVRARDRKVQALKLKISYAENTLAQLEKKRDDEVAIAARNERAGRDVPETTQDAIHRFERQIERTREEINEYQDDIDRVGKEYAPIIDRLKVLADQHDGQS
ncbi:hypothetical protein A11A3_09050 [Alcanivorax hongdengensis A-11-3]|uniref:DUF4124 domain-containing protein n=1 Tax=Alcanivorax hongdengensis A-11-3 TaxID=1177179 RepID=L0WEV2_9GAMM|nr:hypothetical protein [Alcanivorax hongdengensis]EKF74335.1 hypothetical protein A11A3_09050 [Alcanivorax hongdengensis A-11-3]